MATNRKTLQEIPAPVSYAAENALLGALICNSAYMTDARKVVGVDSFASEENQQIWKWLCERDTAGEDINELVANTALNSRHFIDNIVKHLEGVLPISEVYARIKLVASTTICRRAYNTAFDMMTKASQGCAEEVIELCREFNDENEAMLQDNESRKMVDAVNDFSEVLQEREKASQDGKPLRVTSSFERLDRYTYGGYARGNLVIVAARPSVGKTAVALQMAREAAFMGTPTMFFSLEMTNGELIQRLIRSNSDMTGYQLAQGIVDWDKFEFSTGKFCNLPMWLNDKAVYFDDICSKILTASRKGQCGIVFIDYLGLIAYREKNDSLYRQVSDCTRRLKQLAKACDIPIILLCQLNRDMSKEGRAPQLHDLRDSGSIEQDADLVLMLERQISSDLEKSRILNMYVRKNRQGEAGHCIHLLFDKTFSNLTDIGEDNNYIVDIDRLDSYDIPTAPSSGVGDF